MKKHSKGLIFYCVMTLALASMNMLPIPLAMGQTGSNSTTNQTSTHLRIAVPFRGFNDFVKVITDPNTGEQTVSGFAVEVFKAVADTSLPKSYSYNFVLVPLTKPDGTSNATFDDVLKAVNSKEFDGAVGDISIVYYRTNWVDFTFPYMETGISMLVPLQQRQTKTTTRVPLIRVTKGFVAATIAFSLIVAIVFWVMEHRNDKYVSQQRPANPHPPPAQYDDNWRKEILRSVIQTRLVMVLFFMVLLVLIACYAASQTSSLTETHRRSPTTNLNQLIRTEANVGYQQGSFIKNLLIDRGFLESKLIAFDTDQEMFDLLSNGGVDAVIGLTPHLRLRQAGHCDALTLVPTFNLHAAGFGFAFRKGSPVVDGMSNGILKVIYNRQLARIQERTIGSLETCPDDQNGGNSSDMIDTDTLWILVAGAIGVVLLVVIMMLVHCGITCGATWKNKKAVAYPCYVLPCC